MAQPIEIARATVIGCERISRRRTPTSGCTVGESTSMSDRDSDLLGLVANGDMTGALRLLMARHGGAVYRYCREELRDAALADDVQQQVFIEAFRDLGRFRGGSSLRTWLFA